MEDNTRVVPSVTVEVPVAANTGAELSPDVGAAVESAAPTTPPSNIWRSRKGIEFQLYKVNRMIVAEAGNKIEFPEVPRVFNPDQDRWEPNPGDPDYIAARQRAQMRQGIAGLNIYAALGTRIVNLPAGIVPADNPTWSDDLTELGVELPDPKYKKLWYCTWLRLYALDEDEFTALVTAIISYSGHVSEEQVAEIANNFQSNGAGTADNVRVLTPTN